MKIKDKINNQIFNVSSKSVIDQMLSNSKRYIEIKEVGNQKPTSKSIIVKNNKE